MVKIPTATQNIQRQRLPAQDAGLSAPVADVSGVGRAVAGAGAALSAFAETQQADVDRQQEFDANRRFLEFQREQTLNMREAQREVQPGAFGFTQQSATSYQEAANEFARTLPENLRGQYDVRLADTESRLVLAADSFENESRTGFYANSIETGLGGLRDGVLEGDTSFEDALSQGLELVASSGLTPTEKQNIDASWRRDAAAALWRSEYNRDPAQAIIALGGGTEGQRTTYQADRLFSAMITHESGGNPNAISPTGAAGLMQVQPATAGDIAREIGDRSFPANGTEAEQQEYLKQPEVSKQYGQYYMNQQLDKYDGDVEAALIAYNAGPGNADKWLEAGRDYSALPKREETEPYVQRIMGDIGGGAVDRQQFGETYVNAGEFRSQFYNWADLRNDRFEDAEMDQGAVNALDQVTNAFGKGPLRITSGFRSDEHNEQVSFSSTSRHTHGDAFDIDVSGYSDEEKERLISMFVGAGARGVGHYDNGSIHVDFRQGEGNGPGGLALWYNKNQAYTDGASWFSEGVNQGLSSEGMTFSRSGPADSRYDVLDYDTRQEMIKDAERELDRVLEGARNNLLGNMNEGLAFSVANGTPAPSVDDYREEVFSLYPNDQQTAQGIVENYRRQARDADAVNKVASSTPQDIAGTIDQLAQEVRTPGTTEEDVASMNSYLTAVQGRQEAIANDPAGYVAKTNGSVGDLMTAYQSAVPEDRAASASLVVSGLNSVYSAMGVPEDARQYLTKDTASGLVEAFDKMEPDIVGESLRALRAEWGEAAPSVIGQLAREGMNPDYVVAMRHADNPGLSARIAGLADTDIAALKQGLPTSTLTDVRADISDQIADYRTSFEFGDVTGGAAETLNQNVAVAEKLILQRVRNGADLGAATDEVIKQMFPEENITEDEARVIVPTDVDSDRLRFGMTLNQRQFKIDEFDPVPLDDPRFPEFADKQVLLEAASNNGVWTNNNTGDGVILMIAVDGEYLPITNADGERYGMKFTDLEDLPVNPRTAPPSFARPERPTGIVEGAEEGPTSAEIQAENPNIPSRISDILAGGN